MPGLGALAPQVTVPPRRVLAAVDFSEPSRAALTMAARLAVHCGAELHVLHAEDQRLCAVARAEGANFSREVQEELAHFLEDSALPAGISPHRHVVGGPAVEVICQIAARERADVTVVAARGISGAARFLGSVTDGVLRRAEAPVLVVPHTWSPPIATRPDLAGMNPVIAAIDFTAPSLDAVAAAYRFALALHSPLELLHIVPVLPVIDRWRGYAVENAERSAIAAQRELRRLAHSLASEIPIETALDTGLVAERIAAAARIQRTRHPLLILGRRHAVAAGDAPGTTAQRVIALAEVPTLVFIEPMD